MENNDQNKNKKEISRRNFLKVLGAGSVATTAAMVASAALSIIKLLLKVVRWGKCLQIK
ncbi:hypothetical protein JCM10512_3848 [Bacteroides reticulotermitis JCM 10512]|uniref:Twin-arginine translocation signal domain-containing protein n=1 Tax=Bacteroides reticulotermitis JCM 10512 TaxID=1445607 RepID=W4UXX2_9BACE|nr:hypothetical protein JCM10512_3848 [Bacteroides reticulotermitis JCM 10512]